MEKSESISARLGQFVGTFPAENIPAPVAELAKGRLLDILACCYAGLEFSPSRVASSIAKQNPGNCVVIGRDYTSSLLDSIMANSVSSHSTSQDDVMAGVAHPGSTVIPAALALSEQEAASGPELLAAIVLGYELVWRILRGTGTLSSQAVRPGTIFTAFGACAAAGRLMRLDEGETANALGYTASLTPGCPNEGWWGGTMEPMFEIGWTARIGALAAIYARAGATCAPQVFEGRHGFFRCWSGTTENMEAATKDLGKSFAIEKTFMKPFAACGGNQVPMQVASDLVQHRLKESDILKIVEKLRPGGTDYAGMDYRGPFVSPVQALMSMQFCTAATVLGRQVDTPKFLGLHYDDPEVARLAARVELVTEQGRSVPRFEVYTVDGRILAAEQAAPDRSLHVPSLARMKDKFSRLAKDCLPGESIDEIISIVSDLENVKNVRKLTGLLSSKSLPRTDGVC